MSIQLASIAATAVLMFTSLNLLGMPNGQLFLTLQLKLECVLTPIRSRQLRRIGNGTTPGVGTLRVTNEHMERLGIYNCELLQGLTVR